jgi:hypothetical protein
MQTFYIVLANLVTVLHIGYVSFVVLGLLAIWLGGPLRWGWVRNRWFRAIHMLAIAIVAAETIIGMTCPLSIWEIELRELGGQHPQGGDFIANMCRPWMGLDDVPDTHWAFKVMYIGFGVVVLGTLFLVPPRWKGNRKTTPMSDDQLTLNLSPALGRNEVRSRSESPGTG